MKPLLRSTDLPRTGGARLFWKLFLFAGSLFVALVAAELFCRILVAPPLKIRFQQDVDELGRLDLEGLAGTLRYDQVLFWRFAPDQFLPRAGRNPFFGLISNEQGLRESGRIPYRKPENELRVLFLGDSCTFGYGVDHVQSFVQRAEEKLRAQFGGQSIECINAGVPGYTLFQGWRFLETEGFRYQPDIVVACFGWNDASTWDDWSDAEHAAAQPPGPLRASRLCQMGWRVRHKVFRNSGPSRPRLTPDEYGALLKQMDIATRDRSTDLVLMLWGFRFQMTEAPRARTPWQLKTYAFAQEKSVRLVDLIPPFQRLVRQHGTSEVFLDRGHTTSLAHDEAAKVLVEALDPILRARSDSRSSRKPHRGP